MGIRAAIYTRASTFAGLIALVGLRIHPKKLPQGEPLPAVVYQRISTPRYPTHQGSSGLASPRFQFTCWGRTDIEAENVAAQVRAAFDGLHTTIDGVRIDAGLIDNELEDSDDDQDLHRVIVDVVLWHGE